MSDFDVARWRAEFPIFEHKTYINSCSYGALAKSVRAAMTQYLDDRDERGSDWDIWVRKNEELRASYARLLGAKPQEIAVTASASAGMNAIASALDFSGKRRKIIITDFEFPTAAQIWHAQAMRGAEIIHAKADDGGSHIPLEHLEKLIDEETALVCASYVCYRNGSRQDIAAIAKMAHDKGALMMVDAFQALGSFPIDVKALDVDFLVGGVLKYLIGTAGVAMAYVREELVAQLTPVQTGWFAQADVHAMLIDGNTPSPTASRFEAGTPPVPNLYGALAGLELIHEIGTQAIHTHVLDLHDALLTGLRALGAQVATPGDIDKRGAMLAIKSSDEHGLVARLSEENIIASCRDGNLRLSPHFYNDASDIETILRALDRHKGLLLS